MIYLINKYTYNGYRIDGTWELIVAKYLDEQNIKWEKSPKHFDYFWEGKIHCYYPDFYLPEYDTYIEVKGYETKRDLEKYKTIENLILIKANEIKEIQSGIYNIFNYL